VWEFVCKGLESVRARTKEPWNTDDVYRCLRGQRAFLFVRDEGFLILAKREEEWSLEPYLLVWIGHFKAGSALAINKDLFAWLDAQARSCGCKRLRIISPRLGWGMRLKGYFRLLYQIWEREIT
jgi:hypothetical protein